jgi:hypothetical protein
VRVAALDAVQGNVRALAAILSSGYPDEWPQATAEEATTYLECRADA